MTTLGAV
ncbi:hypothetical protein ID866_7518 [Astraeus odoratus]|nr:hypothetical protein ID866_7518 [Astraeus odoratus]